ncbi:MAG TPA: sulfite exporter TauE/SafE family protein [Chloroflexota bacterium]
MSAAVATEIDVRAKWPGIVLIGALTGLLSGLLGIGGAAILVPGMVDLLGMSQHRATGTSLFVIIPSAFFSAIVYALNGQMDWPLVAMFSLMAVLGATLGARATGRISAANLRRLFGIFLLFVAARTLIPGGTSGSGRSFEVNLLTQSPILTVGEGLLGLLAGFLSGLLGIGGGQVLTPGMVFLFDFPQKLAQGISIAFIVPTAISGALTHYRRGNVVPRVGLLLMPASILTSLLGAWIAQHADPSSLRLGFGIFLVYAATRMLAPKLFRLTLRRLGGSQA